MDARQSATAATGTQHKQEIYLKDYQPPAFVVDTVSMLFELFEDHTDITCTVTYDKRGDAGDLILDGGPYMQLLSVELNGSTVQEQGYDLTDHTLTIRNVPDQFTLTLKTRVKPDENTRLSGLYRSGGTFCTQCEAEGFRHITYYQDRPDVMAQFDVRIEADKKSNPILLSNGNPGNTGDLADGRHFAEWHDPFRKSSYLFALVAGDLGCLQDSYTTLSGKSVVLNIYAAEQDLDKCGYAMESLKQSMKWDEDVFGLEYDLDVYNILAVSDFNMGAMENKGLNVFNTKYVLASPETATDSDFDHVQGVIGHEYFHNWTGNRVTCRDWFQLSLKEGLTVFRDQEFSSDMTSRAIKRIDDVRVLRAAQFTEDAGPLAHPVRPDRYVEINNFYTATVYNKGAEVIRMMHTLIGGAAFRKGMDLYFERHDGQAVTCDDFAAAMQSASGKDLYQFKRWYHQAGTPVVTAAWERQHSGDVLVTLTQSCLPTPGQPDKKPFHMPVLIGWLDATGKDIQPATPDGQWRDTACQLELTEEAQSYRFESVPTGAVPSLLRGFSAPVKLEASYSRDEKLFLMACDSDPFAKWEIAQDLSRGEILHLVETYQAGRDATPHSAVVDAYGKILSDTTLDQAFLAELLSLPSENDVGQAMDILDPENIHKARTTLQQTIAKAHAAQLQSLYESAASSEAYDHSSAQKAGRRLRSVLLGYLRHLEGGHEILIQHYRQATNMTDQGAALAAIINSDCADRTAIISAFYDQWQHEALVIDKWFMMQAVSTHPETLGRIHDLYTHDAFTLKNPNRMRALVLAFASANPLYFHHVSGSGYAFLKKAIVEVDALNPQVAARMVAPLGRWKRVDKARQTLMVSALQEIADTSGISDDVRELVNKSLETK